MFVSGTSGVHGDGDGNCHTWMTLPVAGSTRTLIPFGCSTISPIRPLPRSTVDGSGDGPSEAAVDGATVVALAAGAVESEVVKSPVVATGAVESPVDGATMALAAGAVDDGAVGTVDGVADVEVDGVDDGAVDDKADDESLVTLTSGLDPLGCAERVTLTIVPAAATATAAPTAFATTLFM